MSKQRKQIVTVGRSSYLGDLGVLEVRSVGNPFSYEVGTGAGKETVTSTKVKVLCEAIDEFLEISVLREIAENELKKGDLVDFTNFSYVIEAVGRNGYQGQAATAWLEVGYKADDFVKVDVDGKIIDTKPKPENVKK